MPANPDDGPAFFVDLNAWWLLATPEDADVPGLVGDWVDRRPELKPHHDRLVDVYGSAVRTGDTERWVQSDSYDIFGAARDSDRGPKPDNPRFGYRGELTIDDSVYLRARRYDPTIGRFTTRDPVDTLAGSTGPESPYTYASNDPADVTDPLGKWSISDIFFNLAQVLAGLLEQTPGCPDPGNAIKPPHPKCFQGVLLTTRGYIDEDCLNVEPTCLNDLWTSHQKERAAQAVALNELNKRREDGGDRFEDDQLGLGTVVDTHVDWEVRPPSWVLCSPDRCRMDIVTDEKNIFEVKEYTGPSMTTKVDEQLGDYQYYYAYNYGLFLDRGTELNNWASAFQVNDNFWDYLTDDDTVYVWGMGNPPGHVYFSKDEGNRVPTQVIVQGKRKEEENTGGDDDCWICVPVPPIIRVPVEA